MTIPEDEILDTRVIYTIVGGEVVYRAKPEAGGAEPVPDPGPDLDSESDSDSAREGSQ